MAYAVRHRCGVSTQARRTRVIGAGGALIVNAALLGALLWGLRVAIPQIADAPLAVFDVVPSPSPPELAKPGPTLSRVEEGAAAPPAKRAHPVSTTAPTPVVPTKPPILIPVAPIAANGPDAASGAAEMPGPGTGGGGTGYGTGSGNSGVGSGSGIAEPARHVSGTITNRDYPNAASKAGVRGSVTVTLSVDAHGRVTHCEVARSSGSVALDATTCRLAQQRFRYSPARNGRGEAVPDLAGWRQDWWLEGQQRP